MMRLCGRERAGLLLLTLLVGVPMQTADAEDFKDDVLFTYKGAPVTVQSLTLVSAAEAQRAIAELNRGFDPAKTPPDKDAFYLPAAEPWQPKPGATLQDFYRHDLNGVLEWFIRVRVLELLHKQYPVDTTAFHDASKLDAATQMQAALEDKFEIVMRDADAKAATDDELVAAMNRAFPKARDNGYPRSVWLWARKLWKTNEPYQRLNALCLPRDKNGRIALWYTAATSVALTRGHLQAYIEAHKAQYVEATDERFGNLKALLFTHVGEEDRKALDKLVATLTNDKGDVALEGLQKANKTLTEAGSSTRIELWIGSRIYYSEQFHIPEDDLKAKQYLLVRKEKDGTQTMLLVFQAKADRAFKESEYSTEPGKTVFSTGAKQILTPLIRQVVNDIKPVEGISIRSEADLFFYMWSGHLFDNFVGEPLPRVVLK